MNTKAKIIAASTLLVSSGVMAADISTTLSATNDYRYRGISQSAGEAALQGSVDVAFENGLYVGTWASNIDFEDDANLELDFYIGYYGEINDLIAYDITLSDYTYPGYDSDIDYLELATNIYIADFTVQYAYTNDFSNSDKTSQYIALDYSYLVAEKAGFLDDVTVNAHIGHSFGDYWTDYDIGTYTDLSVGVSASIKTVDVDLRYLVNDIDSEMELDKGAFRNDNIVLLTVSKTFDLFSF